MKNEPKQKDKVRMSDFFTSGDSEKGAELAIISPKNPKQTFTLLIRGADSEIFRRAQNQAITMNAQLASQIETIEGDAYHDQKEDNLSWLLAHCIKSWPFEEKLTIINAQKFLKNSPTIQDQINSFAGAQRNFVEVNLEGPPTKS